MLALLQTVILAVISILPDSPFQTTLDGEIYSLDFLPYLNWFIPFDNCLKLMELWLVCIVAYYSFSFVKYIVLKLIIDKIL